MHETIPVEEIMVTDVVTVSPSATAAEAARTMRERGVSSVVVAADGDPIGIVTEGDFIDTLCHRPDAGNVELSDLVSSPLVTIASGTSIVEAVERLRSEDLEHLPVVDDGALVGIVTTTELSHFVPQLAHRQVERRARPPRRQVRTDTLYERDDWSFEYRGEDESRVSVGDVAEFSKTIDSDDVEAFAEVTGDTNRVHLEDAYAAETRFGERIVHGVLSLGLVSAALARLPGLTIYLSQECSFQAPIGVGDRATAVCEVLEDLGREKYRIETTVRANGEIVLEGEAVVLVDEIPPESAIGIEDAADA